MKTIEIVPHGGIASALPKQRWRSIGEHARVARSADRRSRSQRRVFVSYSSDLDESFVEKFRKKAAHDMRLLILNDRTSTDRLLSRIVDLQIRTPQRFYILEASGGSGKTHSIATIVWSLLKRMASAVDWDDSNERILDGKVENGVLQVVSTNFNRLDVPIAAVAELKNQQPAGVQNFEIDEDGSFIYWPKLDVHLGWRQLQQIVDPETTLKAYHKGAEFNKRYGRAVREFREQMKIESTAITGLSEKQLRRIEKGECRLTSNAIEALAEAHKLEVNEYMKKLAEAMR